MAAVLMIEKLQEWERVHLGHNWVPYDFLDFINNHAQCVPGVWCRTCRRCVKIGYVST